MSRLFVFCALVACLCGNSIADVIIDEADFGDDFSNDPNAPTAFGSLEIGKTIVSGITSYIDLFEDPDIFTFTIDPDRRLDSVSFLSIDDDRHFFGLDDGNTSDSGNGTQLLIATLVGGDDIDVNLLQLAPGDQFFGGTHQPGPLGPGDYTIWFQENTIEGVFGYAIALETSAVSAIPEPASGVLLCVLGAMCGVRRRRRSRR